MKLWISYLLIALFSLQQLPVKELSKLLLKKVCTEQSTDDEGAASNDNPTSSKQLKEKEDADKFCQHTLFFHFKEVAVSHRIETALHEAQRLVPHFVPDIITPPPNQA